MAEFAAGMVMRRMVAAFESGDARDCHEYLSPSYVDHQGRGGEPLYGPDGFREVVRAAHRDTAPEVWIEDIVADEFRAAARVGWRFNVPGQRSVERETIEMIRVEEGRAVEHWGAEARSRVSRLEE